jgi:hypothetical protein
MDGGAKFGYLFKAAGEINWNYREISTGSRD